MSGAGHRPLATGVARALLLLIALAYGAGAVVHGVSMVGLWGGPWVDTPLKWRVLDVVYLALDLAVFPWLLLRLRFAIGAFFFAATTQILLYTVLRDWVLAVPDPFTPAVAVRQVQLDQLVLFHALSLALGAWALRHLGRRDRVYLDASKQEPSS